MVALSTCEAEYIGQTLAAKEAIWLRNLMREINSEELINATMVYGDNQGAITLTKNPKFHAWTKHFNIQTHFIREKVINGDIKLEYVPTERQVADGMTKPLPELAFARFREALGVILG